MYREKMPLSIKGLGHATGAYLHLPKNMFMDKNDYNI